MSAQSEIELKSLALTLSSWHLR